MKFSFGVLIVLSISSFFERPVMAALESAEESNLGQESHILGRGRSMGMCSADTFTICSNTLSDQAKDEARRDARLSCEASGGKVLMDTTYCQSFCNPLFPTPPPAPPTFVNCDATCEVSCLF